MARSYARAIWPHLERHHIEIPLNTDYTESHSLGAIDSWYQGLDFTRCFSSRFNHQSKVKAPRAPRDSHRVLHTGHRQERRLHRHTLNHNTHLPPAALPIRSSWSVLPLKLELVMMTTLQPRPWRISMAANASSLDLIVVPVRSLHAYKKTIHYSSDWYQSTLLDCTLHLLSPVRILKLQQSRPSWSNFQRWQRASSAPLHLTSCHLHVLHEQGLNAHEDHKTNKNYSAAECDWSILCGSSIYAVYFWSTNMAFTTSHLPGCSS